MEFLRSFLRRHLAGKQFVASQNVSCFLRLRSYWTIKYMMAGMFFQIVFFILTPIAETSTSKYSKTSKNTILYTTNICAPNEDDPSFFKQIFDHLHDFACEEVILGGDFNLVLDVKEDNKGGLPRTYQNALKIINQNCEELNLIDIWRTLNADKHR